MKPLMHFFVYIQDDSLIYYHWLISSNLTNYENKKRQLKICFNYQFQQGMIPGASPIPKLLMSRGEFGYSERQTPGKERVSI
jgi:hypothetical protein